MSKKHRKRYFEQPLPITAYRSEVQSLISSNTPVCFLSFRNTFEVIPAFADRDYISRTFSPEEIMEMDLPDDDYFDQWHWFGRPLQHRRLLLYSG